MSYRVRINLVDEDHHLLDPPLCSYCDWVKKWSQILTPEAGEVGKTIKQRGHCTCRDKLMADEAGG